MFKIIDEFRSKIIQLQVLNLTKGKFNIKSKLPMYKCFLFRTDLKKKNEVETKLILHF